MESTEKERVWHKGPPPHIGWWNASLHFDPKAWRWWDGEQWSMSPNISLSADRAGAVASNKAPSEWPIQWSDYWPEGARVPRVDPRK